MSDAVPPAPLTAQPIGATYNPLKRLSWAELCIRCDCCITQLALRELVHGHCLLCGQKIDVAELVRRHPELAK